MTEFLAKIPGYLYTALNTVISVFSGIKFFDIIDIIVLTFIVYKLIEFCRDSRAKMLLKGIVLIIIMYALSVWLKMLGINWILEKIVNYGIVILVVIFQPELRRILERVGHSSFKNFASGSIDFDEETSQCIDEVCKSVAAMSNSKTGALIVFEKKTPLGEIINTGTEIDAKPSVPMICNIFYPKSPLHDGALIIRDNTLKAAACILPLSSNTELNSELGTRHRAAVGISENSDAVTVIVSEETGKISLTRNGVITRGYNQQTLKNELLSIFVDTKDEDSGAIYTIKNFFKKSGNKANKSDDGEEK